MPDAEMASLARFQGPQPDAVDWLVIGLYMLGIVAVGCLAWWLRRRGSEGSEYFLAGRSLTWPVIGMALFATNISSLHLVSLAQSGYDTGLAMGNFEWMAAFTLIALALFFAPFYLRAGVTTLPDFLEKRYCRGCRDWLAVISILSAVFIHLGFTLYAGSQVLGGLTGWDLWTCTALTAVLTGVYTIVGGLLAVVVTETIQTVVLVAGAALLTAAGLYQVGGWEALQSTLQGSYPNHLTVLRDASDPSELPWYAVFLGYPVIGIWYWCTDQTIVQRVLGARDENHARIGPLFAGFIKILPVFLFVLPGTIYLALVLQESMPAPVNPRTGELDTLQTYVHMVTGWLPLGLRGIVIAALLAALMSTVSGALNSIATLFSYDLVKRWRPETSDHALVLIGRVVTFAAMVVAILWSPLLDHYEQLFKGINQMITYVAPPVTALFVWGVLWRRASARAALVTAWSGTAMGLACFAFEWSGGFARLAEHGVKIPFLMVAVYLFLACSAVMVIASWEVPAQHTEESAKLVWPNPLEAVRGRSWRGLGNYRVVAAALAATMVALYWVFR